MTTFGTLAEGKSNNFDFLRLMLSCIVIFSHSWTLTGLAISEPLATFTRQIDFGSLAVNLFFLTSGFLITQSWLRSANFLDFLKKRVLRIYPAFVVASVVAAVLIAPFGSENIAKYFHDFHLPYYVLMASTLSMPKVPDTFLHVPFAGAVNGSLWTIRYEFGCYLIAALLGSIGIMKRRLNVLVIFLACLTAFTTQDLWFVHAFGHFSPHLQDLLSAWPRFLTYFLAGMAYYLYRDRVAYDWRLIIVAVLALAFGAFLHHGLDAILAIMGGYLFFAFAFSPSIPLTGFGKYGDFSYGVYLYAFPIQQLLIAHFDLVHKPLLMFTYALPLTLVFAVTSWHLIEKRALQLKRIRTRTPLQPSSFSTDGTRLETIVSDHPNIDLNRR